MARNLGFDDPTGGFHLASPKCDASAMKGTVCQLHYQGGGCLRSMYLRPAGFSCAALWSFATAPQGLNVGDAVTFTLTEGGQAVDLRVAASEPKTEGDPEPSLRTGGGEASAPKADEPKILTAAQRKLQRNMNRFHNANLEEQLEMLLRAEEELNAVKAREELDGTALCILVNKLAGFLHAPGETIAVRGSGDASAAGSGLQQKVRKLLIDCLELLDLSDSTTKELVDTALQHIAQLMTLKKLNENQPAKDPSSSMSRKRSIALTQWQTLAALVGTDREDALLLAPAVIPGEAQKHTGMKRKDMASIEDGHYQPSAKVRNLTSVREDVLNGVTLKCSECEQTITSTWFWHHPKNETVYVLVSDHGHGACSRKMGRTCPWLPIDGRPRKTDNFKDLDFCHHRCRRSKCVACGGSEICEHSKRHSRCKFCKGRKQAARVNRSGKKHVLEEGLSIFRNLTNNLQLRTTAWSGRGP
eukprot:Skav212749  [mRNA]  locus=scaffold2545:12766:14181:- [translate_table: standard]